MSKPIDGLAYGTPHGTPDPRAREDTDVWPTQFEEETSGGSADEHQSQNYDVAERTSWASSAVQ